MSHPHAIIIGGGPAGSTLAWQLGRQGLRVLVLDKQDFPRHKVCAGWITPAVNESLQLDLADYARGRTLQPIHGFRTGLMGGRQVHTPYDRVISYGIRRHEFDDYLLRRSGAELALGESLQSAVYENGLWTINQRWQTPLLIGAGGHYCPVARQLGARLGPQEGPVTAQEAEFRMTPGQAATCPVDARIPELFFTPELDGYGWVFRKGDILNVGFGCEAGDKLGARVDVFVGWLQKQGKIPRELPVRMQGHAYLFHIQRQPRRLHDEGVLLIGDAAGLAYPQSGEGIRPAVESALLAAQTIREARGDYRATHLQAYAEQLHKRFGRREKKSAASFSWLPQVLKRQLARQLLATRSFTRHVVLDRWFLHRAQDVLQAE